MRNTQLSLLLRLDGDRRDDDISYIIYHDDDDGDDDAQY